MLNQAAEAYVAALGERLLASYALGSLAHGGFSPLVSDIDLGLVLADPVTGGDGDAIQRIAEAERAKGSELQRRLSVFWGTPATLGGRAEGGRFPPLDRLDLLENGRLLARRGRPRRAAPPRAAASCSSPARSSLWISWPGSRASATAPRAGSWAR